MFLSFFSDVHQNKLAAMINAGNSIVAMLL